MVESLSQRVYRTVGPHIVTLSCVQKHASIPKPKLLIFSGFLVDVDDVWFYVTAGHILHDVRAAQNAGATFDIWRLSDYTAGARYEGKAIPYDFQIDNWIQIYDESRGLDYAAVPISDLYRRQLEAGNAAPIDRQAWGTYIDKHDSWVLAGIPSESIEYDDVTMIKARVVIAPLCPATEPQGAEEKAENQFFAAFADDPSAFVEDIDGMSGAPIFSLRKDGDVWKYSVIGVQSGWYKQSKILAVCPFSSFGEALEDIVREAKKLYAEIQAAEPNSAD